MRRFWAVVAAVLLPVTMATTVVSGPASAHLARAYHAIDLGTLGGPWATPFAVNNRDEVVGVSATADRQNHPFLWRRGTMIDLAAAPGSAGWQGNARDINDRGQVVGAVIGGGAYLWDHGVITELTAPGFNVYSAEAINNRGQIVGSFNLPEGGPAHGYLWERGTMTDLGEIDPVDINDRGQILAGRYVRLFEYRATVWQRGHLTDLDEVDSPVAINNRGWVAGLVVPPDSTVRAVLWRSGTLTRLGTLGGTDDRPTSLNDRGQVLGTSVTASDVVHGVIWEHGRTIDLATRGVVLQATPHQGMRGSVYDINDRGHLTADLASPPDFSGPAVLLRLPRSVGR
jgi:probable HAF family extracellular repeat protein